MRLLIRMVTVLSGVSVLGTVWFVAAITASGGLGPLLRSGLLGGLTIVGWISALVVGPVAAVQLWTFRENGRRAGIILFGFGLLYYMVGLIALRAPDASIGQIVAAATMFAVTLNTYFQAVALFDAADCAPLPIAGEPQPLDGPGGRYFGEA